MASDVPRIPYSPRTAVTRTHRSNTQAVVQKLHIHPLTPLPSKATNFATTLTNLTSDTRLARGRLRYIAAAFRFRRERVSAV